MQVQSKSLDASADVEGGLKPEVEQWNTEPDVEQWNKVQEVRDRQVKGPPKPAWYPNQRGFKSTSCYGAQGCQMKYWIDFLS